MLFKENWGAQKLGNTCLYYRHYTKGKDSNAQYIIFIQSKTKSNLLVYA